MYQVRCSFWSFGLLADNPDGAAAAERFQDAAAEHQRNVQRHLSKHRSSSPTEEATSDVYESSEEEDSMNDESILQSMLKSFQGTGMGELVIQEKRQAMIVFQEMVFYCFCEQGLMPQKFSGPNSQGEL